MRILINRGMAFWCAALTLLCVTAAWAQGSNTSTSQATPVAQPAPCAQAEWRQFNFWAGDWELTWPASPSSPAGAGENHVHWILGNCVLEENFSNEGAGALHGKSVSTYNPQSGKWLQTWVDDQGSYLDFSGAFKDGQMVLSRHFERSGKSIWQRMVYKNITANEFDWSWERSTDDGKTWQVMWPIHYKRKM